MFFLNAMKVDKQEEHQSAKEEAEGVCCMRAIKKLNLDFEKRLALLETKMKAEQKKHAEYAENLKQCINLRDEQISAMREQLKTKDEMISDMKRRQMVASDNKITELLTKVESLTMAVQNQSRSHINETKRKPAKPNDQQIPGRSLKAAFTKEYILRYYTSTIEYLSMKRDLCPFKVEKSLMDALGGKSKKITNSGKN